MTKQEFMEKYTPTAEELQIIRNFEKENGVPFTDQMITCATILLRLLPKDLDRAIEFLKGHIGCED